MNKIQYNFQMLNQDPLQFYIMKHHHTKIVMRPITKIHMGTKTQCHFTPLNHASIQFYQLKNCHTKDCDETHHTNTHTKPDSTLQMLNDKYEWRIPKCTRLDLIRKMGEQVLRVKCM
jgi:hypothetical protein